MFERVGVDGAGVLVHDASVVDSMVHYARVSNIAECGKFRAIADLAMLRVDDQDGRQWWACDGWDAAVAEVGAALGIGKREASGQLSMAVALRFRLPRVAAVFADGGVSARTVGTICWRTRLVQDPNTWLSLMPRWPERCVSGRGCRARRLSARLTAGCRSSIRPPS